MLYVLVVLIALPLAGFLYERIAAANLARRNPPPGRLIDVGGHRLHIRIIGERGPVVVLESGAGSPSVIWEMVIPAVAKFARVVVYDRAGYGWSEPGPAPRTGERVAGELHTLLHKAGIAGPYILVGHSFGGLACRIFTARYPDEVTGLVLVDATHEDELTGRFPPEHIKGQRMLPKVMRALVVMSRFGVVRLMAKAGLVGDIVQLAKRFPAETGALLLGQATQTGALSAAGSEMAHIEESYAQARAGGALGDRPLVVLTHGLPGPVPPGTKPEVATRIEVLLKELAEDMSRLSSRGSLVLAEQSGHEIMAYEPALVVEAVRAVIDACSP